MAALIPDEIACFSQKKCFHADQNAIAYFRDQYCHLQTGGAPFQYVKQVVTLCKLLIDAWTDGTRANQLA